MSFLKKPLKGSTGLPAPGAAPATKVRKRTGPKPMTSNARMRAIVFSLAKRGRRERWIYLTLGISAPTWIRMKRDDPKLADVLARGEEAFHNSILDDALRMSKNGNVAASIFLLKSRHQYSETDQSGDAKPQVIINLPGPTTAEQYTKALTIEATKKELIDG